MPRYEKTTDIPSRFGEFGGRYIPETLVQAHEQLEEVYVACSKDPAFAAEMASLFGHTLSHFDKIMFYFSQLFLAELFCLTSRRNTWSEYDKL